MLLSNVALRILYRLYTSNIIGAKHTPEENARRGIPSHEQGNVKAALKNLIKEGLIVAKPTGYGREISLNAKRIAEIRRLIGED